MQNISGKLVVLTLLTAAIPGGCTCTADQEPPASQPSQQAKPEPGLNREGSVVDLDGVKIDVEGPFNEPLELHKQTCDIIDAELFLSWSSLARNNLTISAVVDRSVVKRLFFEAGKVSVSEKNPIAVRLEDGSGDHVLTFVAGVADDIVFEAETPVGAPHFSGKIIVKRMFTEHGVPLFVRSPLPFACMFNGTPAATTAPAANTTANAGAEAE